MSEGRAFQAEGPACEKERSPNLAKLEEDVDLSQEREQAAVTVVRLLSFNISKNCALCDKSTKFGTDVNYYNTKFFRY